MEWISALVACSQNDLGGHVSIDQSKRKSPTDLVNIFQNSPIRKENLPVLDAIVQGS